MAKKLIVVIGITGNQGGSVATRFLQDPAYTIRGLTRNPDAPAALKFKEQGVEIVKADLDDPSSLEGVFEGASLVFCVTNYWEPFFRPDLRVQAEKEGKSYRKFAGEVEERQGRNVADAVAKVVDGLDENGFIASTLSHSGKCSKGKYKELYHFDAKADIFPYYVEEKYPELAKKMSCVQTGFFMTSWKLVTEGYFTKQDDTIVMSFPTAPEAKIPQVDINTDMGPFCYAVSKLPPGKAYMCEGTTLSWPDYIALWGKINGVKTRFDEISIEKFIEMCPDKPFGEEAGDMFLYSTDPGYDGGDDTLWTAEDIRKAGVECPMTSLEEYFKKTDWTSFL